MSNIVVLSEVQNKQAIAAMHEHHDVLAPFHGWNHRVGSNDKLIPMSQCQLVVAKMNADLAPAGDSRDTANQVLRLVGSYPPRSGDDKVDASMWQLSLTAVYAENPKDLHSRATTEILKRCKFRPTVAEVSEIFEELRGKWQLVKFQAEQHLKEHKRRQKEAERKALLESEYPDRDNFLENMKEKYGLQAVAMAEAITGADTTPRKEHTEALKEANK